MAGPSTLPLCTFPSSPFLHHDAYAPTTKLRRLPDAAILHDKVLCLPDSSSTTRLYASPMLPPHFGERSPSLGDDSFLEASAGSCHLGSLMCCPLCIERGAFPYLDEEPLRRLCASGGPVPLTTPTMSLDACIRACMRSASPKCSDDRSAQEDQLRSSPCGYKRR